MSRQNWEVAETIFSSGASRVTVPDELIEMVQFNNYILSYLFRSHSGTGWDGWQTLAVGHIR